jgi:hypothetical protein
VSAQTVRLALEEIAASLGVIEDECENYGGWAGVDVDAKTATELGMRLAGVAWPCAIGGREYAESGDRSWEEPT